MNRETTKPAADAVATQRQRACIGEVRLDGQILNQVAGQATHDNHEASQPSHHETQQ